MVSSAALLEQLDIDVWCGVHDRETHMLSANAGITRSAAGIRRAWEKWGNDIVLAIGDAPTAIVETTRLDARGGLAPATGHWAACRVLWGPGRARTSCGGACRFRGSRIPVPAVARRGRRVLVNAMMIGAVDHLAGEWPL